MSSTPNLPSRPRRRGTLGWIIAAIVVVIAIIVVVFVVVARPNGGSTAASSSSAPTHKTVKIGVTDKSEPYWKTYTKLAKERLGVTVQLVNFSDYSLPNPALKDRQLDINQFQHIQYLANYNVGSKDTLQPIGATAVYPLPLYSLKAKDVSGIQEGATIAIPNDAINEARALLVLQSAKLLTLKSGGSAFSTVDDIKTAKVKVNPIDASQTANALQQGSVAGAVVNNNFATSAGLKSSARIYEDNPKSSSAAPYVNVFAVRNADKHDKTYLALAKLIQTPAVKKEFVKSYPDAVIRNTSAATLQKELRSVQRDAKQSGVK